MTACAAGFSLDAPTAGAQESQGSETALPPVVVTAPPKQPAPKKSQAPKPDSPAKPPIVDAEPEISGSVVQTTAGPVDGYRALTARSATNTDTPIEELPQSIQVIPRSIIDDQTALGIDDAVKNVSGVQGTYRLQTPAYDSAIIRGYFAEQWIDGLPVLYNPGYRDGLAHVERIEVLKGPNTLVSGGGLGIPIGGALNVVSKLPTPAPRMEVGATVGTDSYYRPYFDVNQPVAPDGSVLFRMTGEYLNAGSFVDEIETESYALHPTLTLDNKTSTRLILQGRVTRWEQPEYQGLPATGTVAGDFRIAPDLFIGPSNIPDSFSSLYGVTATLDHAFTDTLAATVKARWGQSEFTEYAQSIVGADAIQGNVPIFAPSTWALTNGLLHQEQEEFIVSANLRATFAGPYHESTLLVGGDYSRVSDRGGLFADLALGGAGFVDLADPVFDAPYVTPPRMPATALLDARADIVTQGLYLQLQSTVADRVHLLGGLRLAQVEVDHYDVTYADWTSVHETRVLPRLGALVDLTHWVSAYASYSEGLQSHHLPAYFGLPEPEHSRQREAGLKFDLGNGLTGTAALFEIERFGVPVLVNIEIVGTSEERSRGLEFDAIWQSGRNWSVLASYAHVDAVLTKPNAGAPPGARRVGIPEHSGRLWVNYAFDPGPLGGWSVGAGLYAASGQAVDITNAFFTDDYMTVDAKIAYATDAFTVTAAAKNLLDEDYFVSHRYLGGRVARGEERAFYLTVSHTY